MRTLQGGAEFPERRATQSAMTLEAPQVFQSLSPENKRLILVDAWPELARIALKEVNLN